MDVYVCVSAAREGCATTQPNPPRHASLKTSANCHKQALHSLLVMAASFARLTFLMGACAWP